LASRGSGWRSGGVVANEVTEEVCQPGPTSPTAFPPASSA
jgi:hypothetical protein